MCGRIFEIYTAEDLSSRYLDGDPVGLDLAPTYNLCPTEESPVLRVAAGKRKLERMRWQLVPRTEPAFSTKLSTINARSESVFNSRLYGDIVRSQRCIVPISGFYEWKRSGASKRPFKILMRDMPIMSVAGIWDAWRADGKEERFSFSILTTSANEVMRSIHDRMPVILDPKDEEAWLAPDFSKESSLREILKACPDSWLETIEVSPLVNSTKNNSPELLTPADNAASNRGPQTLFEL
jgi:putative SOS response-associated peptidase YedK